MPAGEGAGGGGVMIGQSRGGVAVASTRGFAKEAPTWAPATMCVCWPATVPAAAQSPCSVVGKAADENSEDGTTL